jgi:hypothetical protein
MAGTVTLFDPTAPSGACAASAAPGTTFASLAGKVVGFIDNAKPNFNHLADDLGELLMARYGVKAIVKRRKSAASIPAPPDMLREVSDACDVVITGSGD